MKHHRGQLFMDDAALSSAMKGLASGQSTAEMARMRGVMWRVLLGLLPTDTTTWAATLTAKRQEYADLMEKYRLDPSKVCGVVWCCGCVGCALYCTALHMAFLDVWGGEWGKGACANCQ